MKEVPRGSGKSIFSKGMKDVVVEIIKWPLRGEDRELLDSLKQSFVSFTTEIVSKDDKISRKVCFLRRVCFLGMFSNA